MYICLSDRIMLPCVPIKTKGRRRERESERLEEDAVATKYLPIHQSHEVEKLNCVSDVTFRDNSSTVNTNFSKFSIR